MTGGLTEWGRLVAMLAEECVHTVALSMHGVNHVCGLTVYD
jgi:hypothetical protein